jgi:hypothetical protein
VANWHFRYRVPVTNWIHSNTRSVLSTCSTHYVPYNLVTDAARESVYHFDCWGSFTQKRPIVLKYSSKSDLSYFTQKRPIVLKHSPKSDLTYWSIHPKATYRTEVFTQKWPNVLKHSPKSDLSYWSIHPKATYRAEAFIQKRPIVLKY